MNEDRSKVQGLRATSFQALPCPVTQGKSHQALLSLEGDWPWRSGYTPQIDTENRAAAAAMIFYVS